jgi:hypothetical protein
MSVISIVPFCPILRCTVSLTQNTASRASLLRPHKARKHVLVGCCECTWEARWVQAVGGRAAKRGGSASSGQSSCSSHRLEASCVSDAAKRLHRSPDRLSDCSYAVWSMAVSAAVSGISALSLTLVLLARPSAHCNMPRQKWTRSYHPTATTNTTAVITTNTKNHVPHAHAHSPAHCTRAVARTTAHAARSW